MKSSAKARRVRVIAMLENQLKAGTKTLSKKKVDLLTAEELKEAAKYSTADAVKLPLTEKDRERIEGQIQTLKTRI